MQETYSEIRKEGSPLVAEERLSCFGTKGTEACSNYEKEAVYGALDEWIAWETEFPLIAAGKALRILRKRSQWKHIIQVAKWMLSKVQGATMATYGCRLLVFDMDRWLDDAEMFWDMILYVHGRSITIRLFLRMLSLYDHQNLPNNVIQAWRRWG